MEIKDIRGAIFDLDGTVFDSLWVWEEIDKRFLHKRGFEVPADYSRSIGAMSFSETARYTIERFGLNETPKALEREWMDMAREMYAKEILLKPYAKEFLFGLKKRGVALAIATSSARELYLPALERNGIIELFDVIVDTSTCRGKEFPDIYLAAAKGLGLKCNECAVFEDLPTALRCAFEAGFYTVVIPDRHTELSGLRASYFAKNFKELIALLP